MKCPFEVTHRLSAGTLRPFEGQNVRATGGGWRGGRRGTRTSDSVVFDAPPSSRREPHRGNGDRGADDERRRAEHRGEDVGRGVALKRLTARQHLVEHAAERKRFALIGLKSFRRGPASAGRGNTDDPKAAIDLCRPGCRTLRYPPPPMLAQQDQNSAGPVRAAVSSSGSASRIPWLRGSLRRVFFFWDVWRQNVAVP